MQLHGTAGSIHADMTKVRQILFNLLGNACKFTKDGEITLAIGRVVEGWVQFRVFDTGIGITSSQASRLFQPFVQADASIGRQFGGTGLGFTISRRLCEMMGGSLWLGSEPGMGRCRKSSRH